MHTSRSAVESYQMCPQLRYLTYHHGGRGIVPKASSVPLVTGSAVHRGVEHLANRLRIEQEPSVDTAVGLAIEQYEKDVSDAGFSGKGIQTERQQYFTYCEQKALTEALVRAWAMKEMLNISSRYKVLAVEREVTPIEIIPGVWFQAKVDMELQEIASGDLFNYSLKTCKTWSERNEASYKNDLQGITETWAVEEESRILRKKWEEMRDHNQVLVDSQQYPAKNLQAILAYLKGNVPKQKTLMGIRFCYLVKGQRKKPEYNSTDPNALYITYNPLIRGYKNFSPGGISYAHSWFYPNPENKSGKSILGRGWEPFNVWESDITIKQWIEAISKGEIQPECGDVIGQNVITPPEYFRNEEDIRVGMREVETQEQRILFNLQQVESIKRTHGAAEHSELFIDSVFPHYRKSCEFMYGETCSYKPICWQPEVSVDPLGSGLYQIRTPHHEMEKDSESKS